MGKGAIFIGIACILVGAYWAYNVIINPEFPMFLLIHLFVLIGVGIGLIVFFKEEDKIEERKDLKSKKSKK